MLRPLLFLLLLAVPSIADAQSRGCIERPVGPGMDVAALVPMPQRLVPLPGVGGQAVPQVGVIIPNQPIYGTECVAVTPPPRDILRGEPPPPGGLLRGDDGRSDVLRDPTPTRPPTGWR